MEKEFNEYNGEGTVLRKAQHRLLEMLIEVDRICKKFNIPYWVDGGTALGAVRHKDFIPWDDDIDIALEYSDYKKLLKILPKELPDKFVLQNRKNEKYFNQLYSRIVDKHSLSDYGEERVPARKKFKYQGIFLDIFYVERGLLPVKKFVTKVYYFAFRRFRKRENRIIWDYMVWPAANVIVVIARLFSFLIPGNYWIFGYGIPFNREFRRDEILPAKPIEFCGEKVMGPAKPHEYLERYFGDYMKIPEEEDRATHAERIEIYDYKN
jgi:lipopolysaccharide cholinephosphotransferase